MNYTEADLQKQIKPLSNNAFVAFFQRIARWWLSVWYGFSEKHPKGSDLIYKIFFFLVFSEGVTIFQYLVMTFLPYAFASLNNGPWGWPNVDLAGQKYMILGDAKGLGYFIAFELAVFFAQCINFPLQRNITYRSHGNPWYQAMWYFIGWVLVSLFTNAVWGLCNCFIINWGWPDAVAGLVKTVLTGGVSMLIFFFIFLIIFPDNVKMAAKARAKYEKLAAENVPAPVLAAAEAKAVAAEKAAAVSTTEKAAIQAKSLASARAMQYFAVKKNLNGANPELLQQKFEEAVAAIQAKEAAVEAFETAKLNA